MERSLPEASGAQIGSVLAPSRGRRAGAAEAPYLLVEPLRRTTPLVFASPHSGRIYPEDMGVSPTAAPLSLRRAEDAFVDALFAAAPGHGAPLLCASIARAYVDLNRDPADLDPTMFQGRLRRAYNPRSPRVQAGLGVIPRIAGDGCEIYTRKLDPSEADRRLSRIHAPYHARLQALMEESQAAFGSAILIDCHSMPSCARGPLAPDVVIGDRFGSAAAAGLTFRVEQILRRLGYRVARNAPFAGGYVTERYGKPARGWHAIQIELSRGLYLDERSLEPNGDFERVRRDMTALIEGLAKERFERRAP